MGAQVGSRGGAPACRGAVSQRSSRSASDGSHHGAL